jgi:regulatory protein
VVATLKNKDYLDDAMFARTWIENRTTFRPRSRQMLSMELKRKGVNTEIIDEALENAPIIEDDLALGLATRYARRLQGLEQSKFKMRLSAYLARRGFFYSVSAPIIERIYHDQYIARNIQFEKEDGDDGQIL